jgi:endonuclease YncB( thermonuclease family)
MTRTFALALFSLLLVPGSASAAQVTRVVDGDTVKMRSGDRTRSYDLLGIDAPDAGACGAADAKKALAKLLPRGASVRLKRDSGARGRYVFRGRKLINAAMLSAGAARLAGADTLKQRDKLVSAEQGARAAGKGLWASCPAPPQTDPPGTPPPPAGDLRQMAHDNLAGLMFIKLTQQSSFTTTEARLHLCKDGFARYDIVTISDLTGTFASTVEGNWDVLDATATSARVRFFNAQGETVRAFASAGAQVLIDGVVQTSVERSDICAVRTGP